MYLHDKSEKLKTNIQDKGYALTNAALEKAESESTKIGQSAKHTGQELSTNKHCLRKAMQNIHDNGSLMHQQTLPWKIENFPSFCIHVNFWRGGYIPRILSAPNI